MKPEEIKFVEKWIEALRSGEYKQTRETLVVKKPFHHSKYCCLGVACRVADIKDEEIINDNELCYLEEPLLSRIPAYTNFIRSLESRLITMNDDDKKTFEEIADYIEERLKSHKEPEEIAHKP